jgi:rSAM/selenodomain-associated transferase 1
MAKQPVAGKVKTRLCPPLTPDAAAQIAERFLRETVARAEEANCAEVVLAYAPSEGEAWFQEAFPGLARIAQPEGDLGARLIHVCEVAWQRRYQPCVLIGMDSPDMPPEFLQEAFEALRPGSEGSDVVLGPTDDGGYYLIGLKWREPRLFEEIAWSTDQVFAQTCERARVLNLKLHLLPQWHDIDTGDDLQRYGVSFG